MNSSLLPLAQTIRRLLAVPSRAMSRMVWSINLGFSATLNCAAIESLARILEHIATIHVKNHTYDRSC